MSIGTHPHCFLCHWHYRLVIIYYNYTAIINLWLVVFVGLFCFSFFESKLSGSSKITSHGRSRFLCSTLLSILTFLWLHFIHQAIFSFAVHYLINVIFQLRPPHWNTITYVKWSLTCTFVSFVLILCFFLNLLAVVPYAWFMASSHLDRYWSCDVTLSTFRLWSKIRRRILYPNNKWYGNIQWSCALCSCKRKSGYSCSPSRLYSLYLLKFSR